jgi:hypothetical protein
MKRKLLVITALLLLQGVLSPAVSTAQEELPVYLRDRGEGVATSMFGTYIERGELLIYPFYEYYRDSNFEYEPADFGFGSTEEFRGSYRAHEFLLFFGLGITDWLAVELEGAVIDATLTRAANDTTSGMPDELAESGLGDVEAQLRWRWSRETERRPEYFSYFETVFPLQKDKLLIGTQDWEFKLGAGVVKGFAFGTWTVRAAIAYDGAENKFELGEYALEYLKRFSTLLRTTVVVEGSEDEIELILDAQFHLSPRVFVRLNTGIGLTSKATDLAPEFGVMFSIPLY